MESALVRSYWRVMNYKTNERGFSASDVYNTKQLEWILNV